MRAAEAGSHRSHVINLLGSGELRRVVEIKKQHVIVPMIDAGGELPCATLSQ